MTKTHSRKPLYLPLCRTTIQLGLFVLIGALAACSSVKSHVDKAPVKGRTFSFLNTGSRPLPGYAEERQKAHAMVQAAITSNLATKGVTYTPSGGDVTVAYLIVVGNNGVTTSLNSYFGDTDDTDAFVEKVHSEQTGGGSRADFEAGTLVIDFIEPATSKLLQRRSIQAQILRDLPQETRTARLQGLVDQALKDVPINQ
jgi:hypothetical protein